MPGKSWKGPLPQLSERELALRDELRSHVEALAGVIGPRSIYDHGKLAEAEQLIDRSFQASGLAVSTQTFEVEGVKCANVVAELTGQRLPDEIIVVGGHYDTVHESPGANDNGSGIAAILALARLLLERNTDRTIRFAAFANAERPFFRTDGMGSLVYAKACQQRSDRIKAMLCIESIGYYSDQKGSQEYPGSLRFFYPSVGNYVAFVGNLWSGRLARQANRLFRNHAQFPSVGAVLPGNLPGIGWSDHWSFWRVRYPAIMVTDTALFRYPHYHRNSDTPDQLDYDSMARVVGGLVHVIEGLAN